MLYLRYLKKVIGGYMKKRILTFIITMCFIVPCLFILTACSQGGDPLFIGYEIYIKGTKTDKFECTIGENAITAEDITIKSSWTDERKNTEVALSEFNLSVKWRDEWGSDQTTIPEFWTNGTGSTAGVYATTYEFTLEKDGFTVTFKVNIALRINQNVRVRIFDGTEYRYSAEMLWGHNDREVDTEKHYTFDVENLDSGYDQQEHMQWAVIEKETYDALETTEQKKEFIRTSQAFSTGQIYNHYEPGTYYVFAYVPGWNNTKYGEDADGIIHNYATLTILPIGFEQERVENRVLQHDSSQYRKTFDYVDVSLRDELTPEVENEQLLFFDCIPYFYENGSWKTKPLLEIIDEPDRFDIIYTTIRAHAVQTADGYKLVDLKDYTTSMTEWVYINADGTQGDVVTDNSLIEVVEYSELADYISGTSINLPIYYMIDNSDNTLGSFYDCSNVYKTSVKIKKYTSVVAPVVEVGMGGTVAAKYVTAKNTFEFTYGDKYQLNWADTLDSPQAIMYNLIYNAYSNLYELTGFDKTDYSEAPYYGYVTLNSPHYAWKLDGVNYTSEPLKITYYINKKAEIENPVSSSGSSNYIDVTYDETTESYILSDYITIENIVNEDICYNPDWVNIYAYLMTEEDASLGADQLIEKCIAGDTIIDYDGNFVTNDGNAVGKSYIIVYKLTDTANTTWADGSTSALYFKITLV